MKTCTKCARELPETDFETIAAYKGRKERLNSQCRECRNARRAEYWREDYYPAHTEEHKARVVEARRKRKVNKTMATLVVESGHE